MNALRRMALAPSRDGLNDGRMVEEGGEGIKNTSVNEGDIIHARHREYRMRGGGGRGRGNEDCNGIYFGGLVSFSPFCAASTLSSGLTSLTHAAAASMLLLPTWMLFLGMEVAAWRPRC